MAKRRGSRVRPSHLCLHGLAKMSWIAGYNSQNDGAVHRAYAGVSELRGYGATRLVLPLMAEHDIHV
jgi:hypothetical protein